MAVMWIVVGALLVALVVMQIMGLRALKDLGVRPSPFVTALKAVNVTVVVAIVVFAFWRWVS